MWIDPRSCVDEWLLSAYYQFSANVYPFGIGTPWRVRLVAEAWTSKSLPFVCFYCLEHLEHSLDSVGFQWQWVSPLSCQGGTPWEVQLSRSSLPVSLCLAAPSALFEFSRLIGRWVVRSLQGRSSQAGSCCRMLQVSAWHGCFWDLSPWRHECCSLSITFTCMSMLSPEL